MSYTELNKPEILFELTIRNIDHSPTQTTDTLKQLFLEAIATNNNLQ